MQPNNQPPAPSFGGFLTNAVNDIGNVATGLFSLPGAIANGFKNPAQGGQMVKNAVVATGKSYNDTLGDPVTFKNGQPVLQAPNLGEAAQNFYNHPVNTAINLIPLAKGLGLAKAAAEGGAAANAAGKISTAAAAEDAANGTGEISNVLKPATAQAENPGISNPTGVSNLQAKTFLQPYTVPRGVAMDNNLNPLETAKQMISDGHIGTPQQLAQKFQPIVGADGVVERIKRAILANAPHPVDMTAANKVINDLQDNVPELAGNPAKTQVYQRQLSAMMPKAADSGSTENTTPFTSTNPNDPGMKTNPATGGLSDPNNPQNVTPIQGVNLEQAHPLSAYDSMRAIRDQGFDYMKQGHDANGNVINAEKVNVGQQFVNASNNIRDEINNAVQDNNLVDQFKTPSVVATLKNFSPKFAQRFVDDAHNFTGLQNLQTPYVRMGQMIKSTLDASATAGSKFGQNISKIATTGVGAAIGGAFGGGPAGAAAGALVGATAAPFVEEGVNHLLPFAAAKAAQIIPAAGKVLTNAKNLATFGLPVLSAQQNNPDQASAADGTGTGAGSNGAAGGSQYDPSIAAPTDIPQNQSQLKQNADGTMGIANIYAWKDPNDPSGNSPLITSPQVFKAEGDQLATLKAQQAAAPNSQTASAIAQLEGNIAAQHTLSDPINSTYQGAAVKNNAYSQVIREVQAAGPSIANYNGTYNDFIKQISPKYANLAAGLQVLEQAGGINPNGTIKGATLINAMQTAQAGSLMSLYNTLNTSLGVTGGNSNGGNTLQQAQPAPAQAASAGQGTQMPANFAADNNPNSPLFQGGNQAIPTQ